MSSAPSCWLLELYILRRLVYCTMLSLVHAQFMLDSENKLLMLPSLLSIARYMGLVYLFYHRLQFQKGIVFIKGPSLHNASFSYQASLQLLLILILLVMGYGGCGLYDKKCCM